MFEEPDYTQCLFCNQSINISDEETLWELGWRKPPDFLFSDYTQFYFCPHCIYITENEE